jgi:hypothetical protein
MAWDDERDGILAEGLSNGPRRARSITTSGDLAVGPRFSRRDGARGFKDAPGEATNTAQVNGHVAEILNVPSEMVGNPLDQLGDASRRIAGLADAAVPGDPRFRPPRRRLGQLKERHGGLNAGIA